MLDLVPIDAPDQGHGSGWGSTDRDEVFVRHELTMLLTKLFAGGAVDDEHVVIMTDRTRE